jgi:hypothetical protein
MDQQARVDDITRRGIPPSINEEWKKMLENSVKKMEDTYFLTPIYNSNTRSATVDSLLSRVNLSLIEDPLSGLSGQLDVMFPGIRERYLRRDICTDMWRDPTTFLNLSSVIPDRRDSVRFRISDRASGGRDSVVRSHPGKRKRSSLLQKGMVRQTLCGVWPHPNCFTSRYYGAPIISEPENPNQDSSPPTSNSMMVRGRVLNGIDRHMGAQVNRRRADFCLARIALTDTAGTWIRK